MLETRTIPLVPSLLRSLKNRALRPLLLGWVLDAIALSSLASSFPFFITYVIQPSGSELGFEFTDSSTQVRGCLCVCVCGWGGATLG